MKFRASGSGMASVYRDLLEELQDAPKGSTLKISRQARYTAVKHIRALGLKVLWGKKGDDLYIKIVGTVGEDERPLTIERIVKQAAAERAGKAAPGVGVQAVILAALGRGPCTLKELARTVGATAISCAEVLTELTGRRIVECDDGVYRKRVA